MPHRQCRSFRRDPFYEWGPGFRPKYVMLATTRARLTEWTVFAKLEPGETEAVIESVGFREHCESHNVDL